MLLTKSRNFFALLANNQELNATLTIVLQMSNYRKRSQAANVPTGAIAYFPKNFLKPYGLVETPPHTLETIKRWIQPYSCEWLTRMQVALSELAESLSKNTELLTNSTRPVVDYVSAVAFWGSSTPPPPPPPMGCRCIAPHSFFPMN